MVCPVHSHIISNVDLNLPVSIDDDVEQYSMTNKLSKPYATWLKERKRQY